MNDKRCDIYAKSVVRMRLHLPQMEDPDPTQFGNQMVHDEGSGCFGIFRSEPLGMDGAGSSWMTFPKVLPHRYK